MKIIGFKVSIPELDVLLHIVSDDLKKRIQHFIFYVQLGCQDVTESSPNPVKMNKKFMK